MSAKKRIIVGCTCRIGADDDNVALPLPNGTVNLLGDKAIITVTGVTSLDSFLHAKEAQRTVDVTFESGGWEGKAICGRVYDTARYGNGQENVGIIVLEGVEVWDC